MIKLLLISMSLLFLLILSFCGGEQAGLNQDLRVFHPSTFSEADDGEIYNSSAEYMEGELLVKFRPGVDGLRVQGVHRALGASIKKRFVFLNIEHVKLPHGLTVQDAIKAYRSSPDVEYAEPNYIVRKAVIPNDTYFYLQWGLYNTGQEIEGGIGIYDSDIDAPEAWDIHTGGAVIVAVIDTGIDYTHPDLSGNIWINTKEDCNDKLDNDGNGYIDDCRGWNFVNNNNDPMDDDEDGHGSHVAGIIGAIGNNNTGVSGVNWDVRLMALKVLDSTGSGTIADVIKAIEYAIKMGAKVINASYTYPSKCINVMPSRAEEEAIAAAGSSGILFIAAAGNYGCNNDITPFYPASHPLDNIISVAASDNKDNLTWWSNYGQRSVHVAAPGLYIYSTIRSNLKGSNNIYGYDFMSGTSMATPFVTGLAALIASKYPGYNYQEIKTAILASVDTRPSMDNKLLTSGRINAHNALLIDPHKSIVRPSGLSAEVINLSVKLSWQDNSFNEDGFIIERKKGDTGIYQEIIRLQKDTTTYTDSTVIDGNKYLYRVRAYRGDYYSNYSEERSVIVPIAPPSNLVAIAVSSSGIDLSWTDTSYSEEGFKIERKKGSDGVYSEIATIGANITSYSDRGLSPGTTYFYRLKAYNSLSYSIYSNEAKAETPSAPSKDTRCFIATAVYGSPIHPHVETLREFRDRYLMRNNLGRAFVGLYYRYSPSIAEYIEKYPFLRYPARVFLTSLVIVIKYPWVVLLGLSCGVFIALRFSSKIL